MKALIVAVVRLADTADQLLGTYAFGFGPEHGRRVSSAQTKCVVSLHALDRTQMSAWMYSMMWPMKGTVGVGSAVV